MSNTIDGNCKNNMKCIILIEQMQWCTRASMIFTWLFSPLLILINVVCHLIFTLCAKKNCKWRAMLVLLIVNMPRDRIKIMFKLFRFIEMHNFTFFLLSFFFFTQIISARVSCFFSSYFALLAKWEERNTSICSIKLDSNAFFNHRARQWQFFLVAIAKMEFQIKSRMCCEAIDVTPMNAFQFKLYLWKQTQKRKL